MQGSHGINTTACTDYESLHAERLFSTAHEPRRNAQVRLDFTNPDPDCLELEITGSQSGLAHHQK